METEFDVDVLVIGAGPTGLSAANEALRHGLTVKIIDAKVHRSTHSKALVVHARTLEAFETMGVIDSILEAGVPFSAMDVIPGEKADPVHVSLMDLNWGDTRYPYWLSIPQYETERCLEDHLNSRGLLVDWNTSFVSLIEKENFVLATLTTSDGNQSSCKAKWLIGCDGGRSPVRENVEIPFNRESIGETFVIVDALGDAPMPEDVGTTCLSASGLIFMVPMPARKHWRLFAHMPHIDMEPKFKIDTDSVDRLIEDRLGFKFGARELSWATQFVLKQGLASEYRKGRVFIAGDAAHLHSPVGGQGLNTGVQDAFGLMWRIALFERNSTPSHEKLLDSYSIERHAIAETMVKNTTRMTRFMTAQNKIVAGVRGFVARHALKLDSVQNQLGRTVGMLELSYEGSPIVVKGLRGEIGPGDRIPNLVSDDNWFHNQLDELRHTILVFGNKGASLADDFRAMGLKCLHITKDYHLNKFSDTKSALSAALGGAKLVIVRPDRTIALSSIELDPKLVTHYAREVLGVELENL